MSPEPLEMTADLVVSAGVVLDPVVGSVLKDEDKWGYRERVGEGLRE